MQSKNYRDGIIKYQALSTEIYELRKKGKLPDAIMLCKEAINKYENNSFYPMILGDIYFQQKNFNQAANAFIIFLKRIKSNKSLFVLFTKRYYRLKREWDTKKFILFANQLFTDIKKYSLDKITVKWTVDLIKDDIDKNFSLSSDGKNLVTSIIEKNKLHLFTRQAKIIEDKNTIELEFILDNNIFNRERTIDTYSVDLHCVSVYERLHQYNKALKIAQELLTIKSDPVIIRSIFRICRKNSNYSIADKIIMENPKILKSGDFNILYELIYYHKYNNRIEELATTLKRIERQNQSSIPIQKTVRNFYISFGMLDDARRIEKHITDLYKAKKVGDTRFLEQIKESEAEIGSKIKELYSEVEHHKRLAAISDLTTGISHELGQPITNIRYTIQFYYRMFQKSITKQEVFEVFNSILAETNRMGDLVKRLSPLTSSRNVIEKFDIISHIDKRVKAEKSRIEKNSIKVSISPDTPIYITGDPIHFEQTINNLLLNAIDSMKRAKNKEKKIIITIKEQKNNIIIHFSDTGPGILIKYRGKIFDPFFTTKPPGKGEGLGLFIIWNLLRMHGGKISLDTRYSRGARFIITMPKKSQYRMETTK